MISAQFDLPDVIKSPFGAQATLLRALRPEVIADKYRLKCNVDVLPFFYGIQQVGLYECLQTGYRFWRPEEIAGTEEFYHLISRAWGNYYRSHRWEYSIARKYIHSHQSVLEIGCGKGYFLKSLEKTGASCCGLELNHQAINEKVSKFPVRRERIEQFAISNTGKFDVVCSFQVLEHVTDPFAFLENAAICLAPGGYLITSTPNRDYQPHVDQSDAFDMPPHHMGHFSVSTFQRIESLIQLLLIGNNVEPRYFQMPPVTPRTQSHAWFRFAHPVMKAVMNLTYRITREPGANIVAIYQKPT